MRPKDDRPGASGGEPGRRGAADDDSRRLPHPRLSGLDADSERRRDRTRAAETRAADVIAEGVWDAEPREIPGRLCAVAVDLLPVVGASVALHSDGLPVRLSASSERAARLAEIQATLGEGPCQYAAGLRAPVQARDLTAGPDARRWPLFAQQATAAGIQAAYSMPLGIDTVCVGTLDLYSDTPGELTGRDLHTALLVAGVMTVALMALPRGEGNGGEGDEPWLSGLATDQDEVYQAVGMTMAQLGSDADEALARLRAHAFADSRTVLEVARDVVAHRMRLHRD